MINGIDQDLYIAAINYSIRARRENLCWLMGNVTIDRADEWRDKQFIKLESDLDALVAERDFAMLEIGGTNA